MRLKVLLPFRVFADQTDVSRIVAETHDGSFGLLPRRRDCVAALVPGILTYQSDADGEVFVAIDEGLLTKIGNEVWVVVRRATRGTNLEQLREAVQRDYLTLDDIQQSAREATRKLESNFVNRFARFKNE
ncbi:F0F1 ATP synthase subunit epsilon [Rhodoferax antarcticus]|uniref:Putative ATP synthase F1 epsilon subunit n=1 Tax=Rhodoferax antarcticus ANT.BR TaxID=1111071 RepID=A0A1Q8YEM5_9BURK|nr:F0F1 ATP synthase subunit epsilon [Rhodoferax antarcticus]APW46255.1 F0F1 ATP synthase subunit epsilon [Rhodoferax antarcticus]MCW2313065.1 F-type H+-transporting ATPase subunit epsilon [Rhodoferax antarcticus]OLP06457.1 putative ATP synthase F1 epsilon subunit [Rhodoferax antarcticus ANT.BR]